MYTIRIKQISTGEISFDTLEEAKECGEIALKTLRNGPTEMVGSLKFWLNNENPKWKVKEDDMKSRLPENVNTYPIIKATNKIIQ